MNNKGISNRHVSLKSKDSILIRKIDAGILANVIYRQIVKSLPLPVQIRPAKIKLLA